MRALLKFLAFSMAFSTPAFAQDGPLIPPKRAVIMQDMDLPGGDIAQVFDTTIEACEKACTTNDRCTAFTFNTRNGSCFPKAGPGAAAPYQGAASGQIFTSNQAIEDRARTLRGDLSFLSDDDIIAARTQAEDLGRAHVTNQYTAAEYLTAAAGAESSGDFETAMRFSGAALNLTDSSADWAEYGRLLLLAADKDRNNSNALRERAVQASINAYLRGGAAPARHNVLVTMGLGLQATGRGRRA